MDRTRSDLVANAVVMSRRALIVGVLAMSVSTSFNQPAVGHKGHTDSQASEFVNALSDGVAMDGFDVVAYFDGAPVKGSVSHSVRHKGKLWLFRSAGERSRLCRRPGCI